jgi:hypothetical protein
VRSLNCFVHFTPGRVKPMSPKVKLLSQSVKYATRDFAKLCGLPLQEHCFRAIGGTFRTAGGRSMARWIEDRFSLICVCALVLCWLALLIVVISLL